MHKYVLQLLFVIFAVSCGNNIPPDTVMDEKETTGEDTSNTSTPEDPKARFKVTDSKLTTKAAIWSAINPQLEDFTEEDYNRLKPLILEASIPTLQKQIFDNNFSYEELTKFYLYRIREFDRENDLSLNSVISINPRAIEFARQKDRRRGQKQLEATEYTLEGMPILLKDNINTQDIATTAGAVALKNNFTADAFIVEQLKSNGAIILGKANLSEWAYFFCGDCPSGYSAVGGQTLNPYGRFAIDTGGSSSGSGVAVAANFCVAAIGTETSGSILSPSSSNSVVGLKPTIGVVSRAGIVPISSTLDTPGPMTKTVIDNAILLGAITGKDENDAKSIAVPPTADSYATGLKSTSLKDKRFGAPKRLLEDSLFVLALEALKEQGATIVEIEEEELGLPNFLRLLNLDMKKDLPVYMAQYADTSISLRSIEDFMAFNRKDSLISMPYGQRLFQGIADDQGDATFLTNIQDTLKTNGRNFFDLPMQREQLDGFLSINNYHAGFAAVAEYPAITVPMGYRENQRPMGLTFITTPLGEAQLLAWAYAYEQATKARVAPEDFD